MGIVSSNVFSVTTEDLAERQLRSVHVYGYPIGTTEAAVKAAFPTADEATFHRDKEEWYLWTSMVVFPTPEAAKEAAAGGGSVAGHPLMLHYGGVGLRADHGQTSSSCLTCFFVEPCINLNNTTLHQAS